MSGWGCWQQTKLQLPESEESCPCYSSDLLPERLRKRSHRIQWRREDAMSKPQGYLHSASEALLCLLILGLPHYQSLFYVGLSRVLLFCLLVFLLLFLAKHSGDIAQAIHRCILGFCAGIVLPNIEQHRSCSSVAPLNTQDAFLPPFLKRPPPSLLASRA